jgi:hypothetical protein
MTDQMTPEKATALRQPFPSESVGKLPKGGQMLDYVGHAAVTDRLLMVDPYWSWEPFAVGPDGLPALDRVGNLWIRLTVCGVTRIGVGDGKSAKESIGDAIRNAAMRFGVALDLWAKENLVEFAMAISSHRRPEADQGPASAGQQPRSLDESPLLNTSSRLAKAMYASINEAGIPEEDRIEFVSGTIGRQVESTKEISEAEARVVLDALKALREAS